MCHTQLSLSLVASDSTPYSWLPPYIGFLPISRTSLGRTETPNLRKDPYTQSPLRFVPCTPESCRKPKPFTYSEHRELLKHHLMETRRHLMSDVLYLGGYWQTLKPNVCPEVQADSSTAEARAECFRYKTKPKTIPSVGSLPSPYKGLGLLTLGYLDRHTPLIAIQLCANLLHSCFVEVLL